MQPAGPGEIPAKAGVECIFCKIISGQVPAYKVYEDDDIVAVLDIMPINPGHVLVIPKKHVPFLYLLPAKIQGKMLYVASKIGFVVNSILKADGFFILAPVGAGAGQRTPHAFLHVVPKFKNDNINLEWPRKNFNQEFFLELQKNIAERLRELPDVVDIRSGEEKQEKKEEKREEEKVVVLKRIP